MRFIIKQKNKNSKKISSEDRGFTLVETLIAISIFTMSVVTLMTVLASGISNTEYAKEKITATFLAQEGIEYIRNIRDTYISKDTTLGWATFMGSLKNKCSSNNGCYFNADNLGYSDASMPITKINFYTCGSVCTNLSYDSTSGKYGYTGSSSPYSRKINFVSVGSDTSEIKIISTVSWKQGTKTHSINLSENLYNWVE